VEKIWIAKKKESANIEKYPYAEFELFTIRNRKKDLMSTVCGF
jgi:hypothetical protein